MISEKILIFHISIALTSLQIGLSLFRTRSWYLMVSIPMTVTMSVSMVTMMTMVAISVSVTMAVTMTVTVTVTMTVTMVGVTVGVTVVTMVCVTFVDAVVPVGWVSVAV